MKKIAAYALFARNLSPDASKDRFRNVSIRIKEWLDRKGHVTEEDGGKRFAFNDGRFGEYSSAEYQSPMGEVIDHRLSEPTEDVALRTQVSILNLPDAVVVYVQLEMGGGTYQLSPTYALDVRCPLFVRDLVNEYGDWQLEDSLISSKPFRFIGEEQVPALESIIWHPKRNLPVVIVSGKEEELLTTAFPDELANELVGVALVCTIDSPASRGLTNLRGKEWSCFNGSIRVYWPDVAKLSQPGRHPFWTRASLMAHAEDDGIAAAENIKSQLRKRLHSLSAFSMPEPAQFQLARDSSEQQTLDLIRNELRDSKDWFTLAESYSVENERLRLRAVEDSALIKELDEKILSQQIELQWKNGDPTEVQPQTDAVPTSLAEAVEIAKRKHPDKLYFGPDVEVGLQGLDFDAGPPNKVLRYFDVLADMATIRNGTTALGMKELEWLNERGVDAVAESHTVNHNQEERNKRAWSDGNSTRYFGQHLRPSNVVSPNRCARIYFEYDSNRKKCIVAWVGRHP